MRIRNKLAGVAAATVALTGIAAVAIPTAANAFGPTAASLRCRLYFGDTGVGSSPSIYSDTFTVTNTPASPTTGNTVTVTLSGVSGTGGSPSPIPANALTVVALFDLSGAQSGTVTTQSSLVANNYPAALAPAFTLLGPYTTTGSYVATSVGSVTLALKQVKFDDGLFLTPTGPGGSGFLAPGGGTGSNVDTYCSDSLADLDHKGSPTISPTIKNVFSQVGPLVTVGSVTNQLAATAIGRATNTITVGAGANNWPASLSSGFTATVGGAAVTTLALSTDGGGVLSGTIVIPAAATTGPGSLVVTNGSATANTAFNVLGTPTLALSPPSGGPGAAVGLSGSNWDTGFVAPAGSVACSGAISPCSIGAPFFNGINAGTSSVNASGALTGSVTVAATPATTFIQMSQGAGPTARSATAAFAFSLDSCTAYLGDLTGGPGCFTAQNINALIVAGNLKQQAFNTALGTCTYIAGPANVGLNGAVPGDRTGANYVAPAATRVIGNVSTTQINLGYLQVASSAQTLTGCINRVHVTDQRGGTFGWSLTATMPDFLDASLHTISKSLLAITPTCVTGTGADGVTAVPNSAAGATAGSAGQTFAGTVTLCTKDTTVNGVSQSTSGEYNITAPLTLTVPGFQAYGDYVSKITVTLV